MNNKRKYGKATATGLITAQQIMQAWRYNESLGVIVYAPRGYGKSSFKFHVGAEVLAMAGDPPDWERLKKWIIFTPQQFLEMVLKQYKRTLILLWDDAGYWLNRLFWYESFVKETMRYMTLQRTQFACIMFSTPSLAFLPSKLIELEDVLRAKIEKHQVNYQAEFSRPRIAWVKRPWYSDDLKKHGVRLVWKDRFSAIMPNDFFAWYEPHREQYVHLAAKKIQYAIEKTSATKKAKMLFEEVESDLGKTVPEPEKVKELGEVVTQLS